MMLRYLHFLLFLLVLACTTSAQPPVEATPAPAETPIPEATEDAVAETSPQKDAQNRPLPGVVVVNVSVPNLDGTPRVLLFDGATTQSMDLTATAQLVAFRGLPLEGGAFPLAIEINGKITRRETFTVPDILTLFYPETELPALIEDGRDLKAERIFLAKRYNRLQLIEVERQEKALALFKELSQIQIPGEKIEAGHAAVAPGVAPARKSLLKKLNPFK